MKYLYQEVVQTCYGHYCLELTDEMVGLINRQIAESDEWTSEAAPCFTADDFIEIWADGPCALELPCPRSFIQWTIEDVMDEYTELFINKAETELMARTVNEF